MIEKIKLTNLFIIILILLIISLVIIHLRPKIEVINKIEIKMSEKFKEPKVKASFLGKDLTNQIKKDIKINCQKAGNYEITYSVNYFNMKTKRTVKVVVVDDIKPEIKLIGPEVVYLEENDRYEELGFEANDNNDGNITKKVKVRGKVEPQVGSYQLEYQIGDKAGNETKVTRVVRVVKKTDPNLKNIYLTFDDGPSIITPKILDILKEENIKATFFVVKKGPEYNQYIKRAYDEGHTIALHSATHDYKYIYSSMENYFIDLKAVADYILAITGENASIIRFPGGSSNTVSSFTPKIMTNLATEVVKRGYEYFDWNIDSGDTGRIGSKNIVKNVTGSLKDYHTYVVLMHDYAANDQTAEALREIIHYGKNKGYHFDKITKDTPIVHHGINN